MNINLIRKIIRAELLNKSRSRLLEVVNQDNADELPVEDNITTDDLYIDEPLNAANANNSNTSQLSDKQDYSVVRSNRTGKIFDKLFTNESNKNISVEMIKKVLGAEKSNNPVQHQNDLKDEVYEFFKSKKLSDSQCFSIYQNIYNKKDNDTYLQSLIDFKFNSYKLSQIGELLANLNKNNLSKINDNNTFDYDMYRNNTSPSTGFNIGKGELFLLCFFSDAESGLTKRHDIIGNQFEYEVKQGISAPGSVDFKTKIRRNTTSNSAQKNFLNSLNTFLTKFIASTKHMDEILNLSSQYEAAYIMDEYTSVKKEEGSVAKVVDANTLNSLGDLEDFYDKDNKNDIFYFATIFSGLSAVLSNQHKGTPTFDVEDSAQASRGFELRDQMEKFLPFMDYISGRSNAGSNIKKNNIYDKKFNEESFDKLKKLYFKFSRNEKNKPKIEIIDTSSKGFTKLKKDDKSYRVTPVINVLKNVRELADKNNPIKKNEIIYNASSTSLKQWFQIYFNMVINEYKNSLKFYQKILKDLNEETAAQPDIKFDLIQQLNNNQEKLKTNYLKYEKFGSEENLKQLLNYKVFLDFWKGLSFKDEVVIDIKHYDDNNQLKHRKQIINTIGDEFEILEPDDKKISIDKFFNDVKNDDIFDLRIKNENISEKQFEDVMKAKEIFSFLNSNLNTASQQPTATNSTTDSEFKIVKPINTNNKNNNSILSLLDAVIESLLDLHEIVYNEYANPEEGKDKKKGGIIFISEEKKDVTGFNLIFNDTTKNQYNSDIFKSFESFKSFIENKATTNETIPIIKDIAGSELSWVSYNPDSEYLLTELLNLRRIVVNDLKEIDQSIAAIKTLISSLISKNQGSKNLNKLIKR